MMLKYGKIWSKLALFTQSLQICPKNRMAKILYLLAHVVCYTKLSYLSIAYKIEEIEFQEHEKRAMSKLGLFYEIWAKLTKNTYLSKNEHDPDLFVQIPPVYIVLI